MAKKTPTKGSLVLVVWTDILADPVGDPDKATPATTASVGYFEGFKNSRGVQCLTLRLDKHPPSEEADRRHQSGYIIIPKGCITKIFSLDEPVWWEE